MTTPTEHKGKKKRPFYIVCEAGMLFKLTKADYTRYVKAGLKTAQENGQTTMSTEPQPEDFGGVYMGTIDHEMGRGEEMFDFHWECLLP